jgi:hypothetical protein
VKVRRDEMTPGLYPEWDYGRERYEERLKKAEKFRREEEGVTKGYGFACTLDMLADRAARTVNAVLNLLIPAKVRQAGHRSRSASCVYRG